MAAPTFHIVQTQVKAFNEMRVAVPSSQGIQLNTTLNSKYNLLPDSAPTGLTKLRYFGIGIKGFKNLDTNQKSAPYVAKATNLDLYQPIPIRVVPVTNDLSASERNLYRMRIRKTVGGIDYWCYYLKLLTYTDSNVKIFEKDLATSIITEYSEFDPANLNPTPSVTSTTGNVSYTRESFVAVDASLTISGDELLEAASIIYGDQSYAKISEIGIYTGEDKSHTVSGVTYTEAIGVQLAYHRCNNPIDMSESGSTMSRKYRLSSTTASLL